ncbi:MAG: hypothetical protein WAK90_10595 [Pseudolabrys sp.]|jgi:uncharacterized membrane protein YfcA
MDWTLIGLFLLATFFGGLTSGLTGFAAGLVVSGVWLHILTPLETSILIASYGMVTTATFAASGFKVDLVMPFLEGLPALLLGLWAGVTLYGKLDDAAFRKVILVLLFFSGISLAVPIF